MSIEMEQQQVKLQSIRANLRQHRPDLTGEELDRAAYILYLKKLGKTDEQVQQSLHGWEKQRQVKTLKKDVLSGTLSAEEYNARKKEIAPPRKNGTQKIYNDWAVRNKDHPEFSALSHAQRVSEASRRYKDPSYAQEFRSLEDIEANPVVSVKKSKARDPKVILDLSQDLGCLDAFKKEPVPIVGEVRSLQQKPLSRLEQMKQQKLQQKQ